MAATDEEEEEEEEERGPVLESRRQTGYRFLDKNKIFHCLF